MLININKNVNLGELINRFRKCIKWIGEHQEGCFVSFDGWQSDPRELFQIPEAVKMCQKLVELGFISILETSTSLPDVKDKMIEKFQKPLPFGALEVWGVAKGKWTISEDGSQMLLNQEIFEQFVDDLKPNLFLNIGPNTKITGKTIYRKPI